MQIDLPPALIAQTAPFLDPLALAIVVGGTMLAVLLRSPIGDVARALSALRVLGRRRFRGDALVNQIEALSRIARRSGVLALDRSVIRDTDVSKAIAAIVDRGSAADITSLMAYQRDARAERHLAAINVWTGVAEAAPAMGMIGTLVGLVRMFTTMNDPRAIGAAMAIALLTTLYGALIASLVAVPIASRFRLLASAEASERARFDAPLAALASREQPRSAPIEIAA